MRIDVGLHTSLEARRSDVICCDAAATKSARRAARAITNIILEHMLKSEPAGRGGEIVRGKGEA